MIIWKGKAVSENRRLIPAKGRWVTNPEYRAFKDSLIWTLKAKHHEHLKGDIEVKITMWLNPKMDAQNILKPVLDAIEQAGIIDNDRQIRKLEFTRWDTDKEDVIYYWISE